MNLKNYTSTVPADRSILLIEKKLVEFGANNINKEYKNGVINAITFTILVKGNTICFKLPAKVDAVYNIMSNNSRRDNKLIYAQAERTAWKIIYEWVLIQMSMIQLEQVKFEEIFLPYVYSLKEGKSFFELIEQNNFKALPSTV